MNRKKKILTSLLVTFAIVLALNLANSSTAQVKAQVSTAWIQGYLGSISANGGIQTSIPNINNYTVPFTSDTGIPYFTTYSAISGTSDMPSTQQSKYKEYTVNYKNAAIKPPVESGYTSWHDFIESMVKKNKKTEVKDFASSQTISGNLSTNYGIAVGSKVIYDIVGDLTVNSGTVCDIKAMFIVSGNITINPDVTLTGNNGCLFISKGNTTIGVGAQKTTAAKGSATPVSYDVFYGALIVDGTLSIPVDYAVGGSRKWDGIYLNGTVVANTLDLHRELNSDGTQPGTIFVFDARYKEMFKEDMGFRFYSLREKTN